MIEKILRFSLKYPWTIITCVALIAIYGMYAFQRLPIDAVPDITNNQVQVNTMLEGLSPVQMEQQVTYVVETALAGIPGLDMTRSLTRNGFSQVTAVFDDSMNVYFARQQINERLSEIKDKLPQGAEPHMGPISTGLGEVYMWTVDFVPFNKDLAKKGEPGWQPDGSYMTPEYVILKTEPEKASYLRTLQDWIIKPQLNQLQALADVDSIGGYVRQYHIEPNLEKMIALGLSFEEIIEAVRKNNLTVGPGYIERRGESLLVISDERLSTPKQIETIIIATRGGIPIRVSDIAKVGIGKEMRTGSASMNGHEVVVGTALMLIGANSRTVAQDVEEKLKVIAKTLPSSIEVKPVLNRTKLVNATIRTVATNLTEGAILVIAVLFAFLGYFRAALITALVIPLSMLMTATGMFYTKISGNLMSLGAIDFGLIVDGAVIITENCLRRIAQKQKELGVDTLDDQVRQETVLEASKEMIQPTVYGQVIIIIVYFPILALTGVEGKMFHPMAYTVILALLSAFALSLTFVPAAISLFVNGKVDQHENFIVQKAKRLYEPLLDRSLRVPNKMILGSALAIALAFFLFFQLGEEFIPTLDEKDIAMHALRIPSTSLTQATNMQLELEKDIVKLPEVSYVFSKTGTAEMAFDPMPPNVSDTFIMLKPSSEWPNPHLSKEELIKQLETTVEKLPGNNYEYTQPIQMRFNELISGVRSDLAVKLYGDDFDQMQDTAMKIAKVLDAIPGAADVKVGQTKGLPVLDVKVDRDAASRVGLNVSNILEVVSIAMGGGKAGQMFEGDRRFDIIVKLPDTSREDIQTFGNLPIPLPREMTDEKNKAHFPNIPLNEVAKIEVKPGLNEIRRENGKRFVAIEANIRGEDLGTFVENAKEKMETNVKLPNGYWIEWGGQFENLLSARYRLSVVVPICFALIFLLLFSAFYSVKDALLVFTGVPLAVTGGIALLWLRGMPFSISAAVGFIALSGIAVLNGLVLVTAINQLRHEGMEEDLAIKTGALKRLRPVLMTALVASLGFVPMALATGTGAEVQKPLATVVIGGIISATILTLLVLPALYKKWGEAK